MRYVCIERCESQSVRTDSLAVNAETHEDQDAPDTLKHARKRRDDPVRRRGQSPSRSPYVRDAPMNVRLVPSPPEPEERDDDHRAACRGRRKPLLGRVSAFALDVSEVQLLVPEGDGNCSVEFNLSAIGRGEEREADGPEMIAPTRMERKGREE